MTENQIEEQAAQGLLVFEQKALANVKPFEEELAALKEKHKDIAKPVFGAEGSKDLVKKVQAAEADFRSIKAPIERARKLDKAAIKRVGEVIDEHYGKIYDEAEKKQLEFKEWRTAYEAEEQRIKDEKKKQEEEAAAAQREAEEKLLAIRSSELYSLGATFDGEAYLLGVINVSRHNLKTAPEEVYQNTILRLFSEAHEAIEAERKEQERLRQEAEEKQRQEAERLRLEQEELKRQQEEMLQQRFELRRDRLLALGLTEKNGILLFKSEFSISLSAIKELDNNNFNDRYNIAVAKIEDYNKAEAERKERERIAEENRKKEEAERNTARNRYAQLKSVTSINADVLYKGEAVIRYENLVGFSDEDFNALRDAHNQRVADDEAAAEKARLEKIEKERIAAEKKAIGLSRFNTLKNLGAEGATACNIETLSEMEDEQWGNILGITQAAYDKRKHDEWLAEQEREKERKELEEKERQADMSDGQKWREWKDKLLKFAAEMPDFKTKRYGKMKAIALEKFGEIQTIKAEKISSN